MIDHKEFSHLALESHSHSAGLPLENIKMIAAGSGCCPDCGSGLVRLGACFSCPICGFGSCG